LQGSVQFGFTRRHSCHFETNARSTGIKPKHNRGKTVVDRHDRNLSKGIIEMSKILRNTFLAVVAVAGLTVSAYAQNATVNSCSNHDDYWSQCLGAANNGHNDRGNDRR
jgi:hypothetical protein